MELEVVRGEIAKLELKPGDLLAFKLLGPPARDETVQRVHRHLSALIPEGVKLLVYSDASISIIRKDKEPLDGNQYPRQES